MNGMKVGRWVSLSMVLGLGLLLGSAVAQGPVILGGDELNKVVPSSFYFEGQSAPTQMRNAAAIRYKTSHYFMAGLVDTSGYASSIRAKYEGFLITDVRISVGGTELGVGAYGFGFTADGKLNIFDIAGTQLHSVSAPRDEKLQSPRPLAITQSGNELRLYRGRNYVVLSIK